MDFRIRQRECKHIRLVLQQLGVAKHPQDWHQARLLRNITVAAFEFAQAIACGSATDSGRVDWPPLSSSSLQHSGMQVT